MIKYENKNIKHTIKCKNYGKLYSAFLLKGNSFGSALVHTPLIHSLFVYLFSCWESQCLQHAVKKTGTAQTNLMA